MAITAEQWTEIKQKLDSIIGRVKFKYKEHLLTVDVTQVKRSLKLAVYVDGEINEAWTKEGHEIRPYLEEVWYRKERPIFNAKEKKAYKGLVSKKQLNEKITIYSPTFPSPTALIRQYKKLEGLELVEVI
ncbi:hypothetical protein X781_20830 [Mannheimia sp. USDA-ARS-USMARC-1261]|uniref:hypothetical protein n=1 Tax=Mannheimia sp. USDA-ARS-USMARC-1261 TaxID=1432056 RepID=UPI0003E31F8E|nr:hypothetical protein [Mannheimia sp. USDA-ARS-USMARC-1261]AHG74228.1 hypothetical protein X781_20830 [Mannheimia sp. USDA-ARS-USMARC-1261]